MAVSAPPQPPRGTTSLLARLLGGAAPAVAAATALVALRALVYVIFEQVSFDSDQAIVGLMAKHLSEGRAFPLFFYGQTYMLAVEAWAAAPLFLLAGPTVPVLRFSLVGWNVAFAALLIAGFRRAGLRPWMALAPALFFLAAPPSVANRLVEAQGGIIEPFVYIALLWFLRERPACFGAVLAIGFLNREFTFYAVPVLLFIEAITGRLDRVAARKWLVAMTVFFAVWESVDVLKRFADLGGPGTRGQLLGGFSGSTQIDNLLGRFNWQADALVERATRMTPQLVAWFAGARQADTNFSLPDRSWLFWAAALAAPLMVARLLALLLRPSGGGTRAPIVQRVRSQLARAGFPLYLLGVGVVAGTVFVAGKPFIEGYARYAMLGLLIPVGLTAAVLALEPRAAVRRLIVAATLAWGALMVGDNSRVLLAYLREPPANPAREAADGLVARRIDVAQARYWVAYKVTFFARERVRVASNDFVRIQEYRRLLSDRGESAAVISDHACSDGERLGIWYLCKR